MKSVLSPVWRYQDIVTDYKSARKPLELMWMFKPSFISLLFCSLLSPGEIIQQRKDKPAQSVHIQGYEDAGRES